MKDVLKQQVDFQDLGMIPYQEAWDLQTRVQQEVIAHKRKLRELEEAAKTTFVRQHHLLFCEHPHVYTLGKSGSAEHLLLNKIGLKEKGVSFFKINRGGDITYHGPGQIVGYPIFDLEGFFTDVHRYVRSIEEVVIRTLAEYGLTGMRIEGYTGVWLAATDQAPKRKICAIGVHLSRWVSMHGFAFNINTGLQYFDYIVPCGITDKDKAVTSLQQELGITIDQEEVKKKLRKHFSSLFEFEWSNENK